MNPTQLAYMFTVCRLARRQRVRIREDIAVFQGRAIHSAPPLTERLIVQNLILQVGPSGSPPGGGDGGQLAEIDFTSPLPTQYRNTTSLNPAAFKFNGTPAGEIVSVQSDGLAMVVRVADHVTIDSTSWQFLPVLWPADVFINSQSGTVADF